MNSIGKPSELVLSYQGPFNMRIISSVGKYLTENISALPNVRMNLYRVFIEQCQNVALYSDDRIEQNNNISIGSGTLRIYMNDTHVICNTSNKIIHEHADILSKNCSNINNSTDENLLKLKEKLRRESPIKDTGAHIGLISIKIFSGNSIDFQIIEENNEKFFSISSKISK